jgi:hypothetical protein
MIQTLEILQSDYGGADEYVKKVCGLADEDISKIRNRLLVKESKSDGPGWSWGHVSRL